MVYEIYYLFVKWCNLLFFLKFVVVCIVVNRCVENVDIECIEFMELLRYWWLKNIVF